MNQMVDLRLLRTFCAVAEELHFRRAAARLGATQSGVSQQVRDLEQRLGFPLFRRSNRRVELTDGGRVFLPEAKEILRRLARAVDSARAIQDGRRGDVTVGLIGAATFEVMPRLIERVHAQAPDLRFTFREMTAQEQFQALADGTIDLGLMRSARRFPDLRFETVFREPVICLLPAAHPLAGRPRVAIAELEAEPILNLGRDYEPTAHDFYNQLYRAAGFEPRIDQEVSQIATILFVIATTGCVALGPRSFMTLQRRGVIYRDLEPPAPEVETQLVWNPLRMTSAMKTVIEGAQDLIVLPAPPSR